MTVINENDISNEISNIQHRNGRKSVSSITAVAISAISMTAILASKYQYQRNNGVMANING